MELASATYSRRGSILGRVAASARDRPLWALLGGLLVLAVAVGAIAAHVTVFALDETLIEQSAVHYTSGLPHTLFHDLDARATNRLYSLLLSIPLRLFHGAQALRIDHVLSALLFLSTALPVYAMARRILRSRWLAVASALLSVAVPWLTLSTALFTENLSYPLFWWMILATSEAVWRPSPGRDALALLAITALVCTRVQFAAVFVGYLLALLLRGLQLTDRGARPGRRARQAAAGTLRAHPLSLLLVASAVALIVYEKASGQWQAHVEALLGSYSNVVIRNGLPANMGEGLLVELIALALGVGLLPALVSIPWFLRRMARPRLDRRWISTASCGIVLSVFLVLTVYSQGGYLGPITEERYFFYVIPAFWLGTFAALEDGQVRAVDLLLVAAALALLYASIPFLSSLSQEAAFLDPVESIVPHVLGRRFGEIGLSGLSMQDALALLALVAGALSAYVWARGGARRAWPIVGLAVAVQLLITGYAFAVVDGRVSGIAGRTAGSVGALGWVDANAGGAHVAWLANVSTAAPPTSLASPSADQLRTTLFWNSSVRSWVWFPQLGLAPVEVPMAALPGLANVTVDPITALLAPHVEMAALTDVVGAADSPFLQLQGAVRAHSPDNVLVLTHLAHPVRAQWIAQGLAPDGSITGAQPVRVAAFAATPAPATAQTALNAVLTFASPSAASGVPTTTALGVRLGSARARVKLTVGGRPVSVRLSTCLAAGAITVRGSIVELTSVPRTASAGVLESVVVRSSSCTSRVRTRPIER